MHSSEKYSSLSDYSVKLSDALNVFDSSMFLYSKPPKQMGSFNVSIKLLKEQLSNIKMAQDLLDQMKMMPFLDSVSKKDNKEARQISEEISEIRRSLNDNLKRLKEEYLKQLEVCYKQFKEVSRHITNEEDKKRFNSDATLNFRLMMHDLPVDIPFGELDDFSKMEIDRSRDEHRVEEERINDVYDFEKGNADDLQQALNEVEAVLNNTAGDKLWKEVRKEVAQIKKIFPPKSVTVSKEILEQLCHSDQLILDLEQMHEITESNLCFLGSDGKLQKINKKLDNLKSLVSRALEHEKEKNVDKRSEYNSIQQKVDYATEAVRTYSDILENNQKLEQEKIQIYNGNHALSKENERLKEAEKKSLKEIEQIRNIHIDDRTMDQDYRLDYLNREVDKDREFTRENNQYMSDRMNEQKVTEIPVRYTQMKDRLRKMSSLSQLEMSQSYDLTNGGMAK